MTRRNHKTALSTVFALALAITVACGNSKVNRAAYDTAVALRAVPHIITDLHTTQQISDADYLAALLLSRDVVTAHRAFVTQLIAFGEINATNKSQLLTAFDGIAVAVEKLQANGNLHLKSESAKLRFNTALAAIRVSLPIIRSFIETVKTPVSIPAKLKTGV